MSLSSLRKTYGHGTRHAVINRAIRAECPGGNQCLDSIAALNSRISSQLAGPESATTVAKLEERLAHREAERAALAAQIEAKHNVGPNLNRRKSVAS